MNHTHPEFLDNTNYLVTMMKEWERLTRMATMQEVQDSCRYHRQQIMTDLMFWRNLHHRHVLGISSQAGDILSPVE